jgi:hypothetical protein
MKLGGRVKSSKPGKNKTVKARNYAFTVSGKLRV